MRNLDFTKKLLMIRMSKDNIVKTKRVVKEQIDYKFILHNAMIATSTVIIDRGTLGDFRMTLHRGGGRTMLHSLACCEMELLHMESMKRWKIKEREIKIH